MKIIDVAEHYAVQGGGVKTYIHSKIKAAASMGHEMVIIAPGPGDKIEYKYGGKIIWLKSPKLFVDGRYHVFNDQARLHAILDREEADIVEGGSVWAGGRIVSRWKGNAKKVMIFHQDFVAAYGHTFLDRFISQGSVDKLFYPFWKYLKKLSNQYDTTVVAGEWLEHRLLGFGLNRPKAIPFGIDKSFFSPDKANDSMRRKLLSLCGRTEDCPLFITVSRFHPEKRLKTLFEAVRILNKTQNVAHVIFGEGILSKADRRYAANTPGVCLAGFTQNREELAQAYASSDLLLHGSAAETYGLSVAEAICSGLPIVGPSIGGVADLIGSDNGFTYKAGDANDCARAVRRTLDHFVQRDSKYRPFGGSVQTVEQHFQSLFTYYQELIVEKKNGVLQEL